MEPRENWDNLPPEKPKKQFLKRIEITSDSGKVYLIASHYVTINSNWEDRSECYINMFEAATRKAGSCSSSESNSKFTGNIAHKDVETTEAG